MGAYGLPWLMLSYAATALGAATLIMRVGIPAKSGGVAMLYAAPLAPAIQVWMLFALLSIKPLGNWWAMVAIVQLASMLPLMIWPGIAARVLREAGAAIADHWRAAKAGARQHPALGLVGLGALAQTFMMIFDVATSPVISSDPLEYFAVSRVIYQDLSLVRYPVDPPLPDSGLYARSAHPPSYHLMIVWTYVFQGDSMRSLLARLTQLIYAFSLMGICAHIAARMVEERLSGLISFFALTLVLSIALFGNQASSLHIDVMRITMYALAFAAFAELVVRMEARRHEDLSLREDIVPALATGGIAGFGMFAHSIGILILPCLGLCYFLIVRRRIVPFLVVGAAIVIGALLVGSWQFVNNVIEYGVPVHDSEPIWEMPIIDEQRDVRYRRDLVTFEQRFWRGLLVWFTNASLFGYVHWLTLFPGLIFLRRFLANAYGKVMIIGLASFYFIALTTMLLGMDLVIKNFRYMMTILPFLVVVAGASVGLSYEYIRQKLLG